MKLCVGVASVAICVSSSLAWADRGLMDDSHRLGVSDDVPDSQAQQIVSDLRGLSALPSGAADPEIHHVMHLDSPSGAELEDWLFDRVHYIVGEDWKVDSSIFMVNSSYDFPNPGIFPVRETPTQQPSAGGPVQMVMANIGTAIYYFGKDHGELLGAKIPGGFENAIFSSPRAGVIQIGSGLFNSMKKKDGSSALTPAAATLYRLAVFFHESHHSDGNGKSLGFTHAVCPTGHTYAGYSACDRMLNGAYTVGGLIGRALAQGCKQCSVADQQVLKAVYLDSFDRVLKSTPSTEAGAAAIPSQDWDDTPEGSR